MSADFSHDPALALVRALHLASPALPVGAYSYSQGLEWVVAKGVVRDAETARTWIGDVLEIVLASGEAAVAWRMLKAAERSDWPQCAHWNTWFLASRETAELRAETTQMGAALFKLVLDLELLDVSACGPEACARPSFPFAYALAARGFAIEPAAALAAYLWAWLENQVMAAIRAIPLGQLAGQRLLKDLGARIPAVVTIAQATCDDDVTSFAPGLALASAAHESQYSRLFRS